MESLPPTLAAPIPDRYDPPILPPTLTFIFLHHSHPLKPPLNPPLTPPPLPGQDLNGTTYWEFLDPGSALPSSSPTHALKSPPIRFRRIARPPKGTHHSSIVIPPAWHQWLRHTRSDAPSLPEQRAEVARQERMKVLAAQADARWEAKPRVMEDHLGGNRGNDVLGVREPALETERRVGPGSKVAAEGRGGDTTTVSGTAAQPVREGVKVGGGEVEGQREETWKRMREEAGAKGEVKQDPWRQTRRGAGEAWQPEAWAPPAKGKK